MQINSLNLNGVAGNQRQKPNKITNRTTDPLISPVSPSDLADFLSVTYSSADDDLYNGFLLAATERCISYTGIELLEREYKLKTDYYPQRQDGFSGVGIMHSYQAWWINLPVYPVTEVSTVKVNDELVTDYFVDLESKPARVETNDIGAIEIEYVAGHATAAEISPQLLLGIKMLAAYLYEHRGACNVSQAIVDSGAASLWSTSRLMVSL